MQTKASPRLWRALAGLAPVLAACTTMPPGLAPLQPADALLLGELHDDPRHQAWHRDAVRELAARGRLAALALEMAERGAGTDGLPADANEGAVRTALRWNDEAWPWQAYGPAVMAAVRAGVPVRGANLPRAQMQAAMKDPALDGALPGPALERQRQAVREGHCGLLPEGQIAPMARVQVARDRSMGQVVAEAARPGQTVVLVAGAGHVDTDLGVPRFLPPGMQARSLTWPAADKPARDYCAQLREQLGRKP